MSATLGCYGSKQTHMLVHIVCQVRVRKQKWFPPHTAGRVGSMTRLVHKLQTWNSIKAKQSQPLSRKEIEVQYGSRSVSPK